MDMQRLRIEDASKSEAFEEQTANGALEEELRELCDEVVDKVKDDGILATPLNFQIYFERALADKSDELKEMALKMLSHGQQVGYDDYIDLERHLRSSFRSIKQIFDIVAVIYRNQSLLFEILDKRMSELESVDNPVISRNIVHDMATEINRLKDITRKQSDQLKILYQQSAKVINAADSSTVFDAQYGIYNKHFILTSLSKEITMLGPSYSASLLILRLADSIAKEIGDVNILQMLQHNIAEILLKASRRSDVISHYENGMFAILLRHSSLENAQAACKRLFSLVKGSSTFIDSKRMTLEINIAVVSLRPDSDPESLVASGIAALKELSTQTSAFKVVGG